jgi:hypothetical protein
MKQIDTDKALNLIKKTNGRVFTAIFTKKDGTSRKMNCRLGVQKDLTGQGLAYNPADYDLITVFDMKAKGYRMLNLQTLTALQINGQFYVVE